MPQALDGGSVEIVVLLAAPGGTGSPEGLPGPDAAVIDAGPAPA